MNPSRICSQIPHLRPLKHHPSIHHVAALGCCSPAAWMARVIAPAFPTCCGCVPACSDVCPHARPSRHGPGHPPLAILHVSPTRETRPAFSFGASSDTPAAELHTLANSGRSTGLQEAKCDDAKAKAKYNGIRCGLPGGRKFVKKAFLAKLTLPACKCV